MAKEDEILKSFMAHPLLSDEYNIPESELPQNILEGIRSEHPIIQAIATIIKETQRPGGATESDLQRQVFNLLSKKPL